MPLAQFTENSLLTICLNDFRVQVCRRLAKVNVERRGWRSWRWQQWRRRRRRHFAASRRLHRGNGERAVLEADEDPWDFATWWGLLKLNYNVFFYRFQKAVHTNTYLISHSGMFSKVYLCYQRQITPWYFRQQFLVDNNTNYYWCNSFWRFRSFPRMRDFIKLFDGAFH